MRPRRRPGTALRENASINVTTEMPHNIDFNSDQKSETLINRAKKPLHDLAESSKDTVASLRDKSEDQLSRDDQGGITLDFAGAAMGAPIVQSTPLGRLKRRTKAPTTTHPIAKEVSPLPPSSPPIPTSEDLDLQPIEDNKIHWSGEEEDGVDDDDPFGFFAAEKKLKARRERMAPKVTTSQVRRNGKLREDRAVVEEEDDLYADEDQEAFAMDPHIDESEDEMTPNPRATPHKRATKRKPLDTPSSVGVRTPHTSSMPSTPSPSKPTASDQHRDDSIVLIHRNEGNTTRKGKGREKKKVKGNESGTDYDEMDPVEYSKRLEGLLPKRRARRTVPVGATGRVQGKRQTRRAAHVIDSEDDEGQKRGKKPSSKRTASRSKTNKKAADDAEGEYIDLDPEEKEKFMQDRQERLEYFKKLEQYELQKENLYIV